MDNQGNRRAILEAIAPCAFCCLTCAAMENGIIAETSRKLRLYLDGYYEFKRQNLPFKYRGHSKKIKVLTEQLERMSDRPCRGCRNGADQRCCIPDCPIPECARQHQVDFCGECDAFPCNQAMGFFKGETLKEWEIRNRQIRENGAENYYQDAISRSHYHFYRNHVEESR